MSLFKKALASFGFGGAKVDTILEKDTFIQGEEVKGIVHIEGGNVKQKIDDIYLSVLVKIENKEQEEDKYFQIQNIQLIESFFIDAKEQKEIPFSFVLSPLVPITLGKVNVWISTRLSIKSPFQPKDNDLIKVLPNVLLNKFLKNVEHIGFSLKQADCIESTYFSNVISDVVQKFIFCPNESSEFNKMESLEINILCLEEESLELGLQINKINTKEKTDLICMSDSFLHLKIKRTDIKELKENIIKLLE